MRRLFLFFLLIGFLPRAHAETFWDRLRAPEADPILVIFEEISKVPRPSGGEAEVRALVERLTAEAAALGWNGIEIPVEKDAAGNVLIRLPGRGRYAGMSHSVAAIQAHFDMVFKHVSGSTDSGYFQGGVKYRITNGVMHSAERQTTLGADNGIGLAMALRYAFLPYDDQPPLEILITVDEERGMKGAKALELKVKSPAIINLDDETAGSFCFGCQGSGRLKIEGDLPVEKIPPGYVALKVSIEELKGGHSGADIHLSLMNAVLGLAEAVKTSTAGKPIYLLDAVSGAMPDFPSSAQMRFAVPEKDATEIEWRLRRDFFTRLKTFTDESLRRVAMGTVISNPLKDGVVGISAEGTRKFFETLGALPNGVIPIRDAVQFPNSVRVSSNLGYLSVKVDGLRASATLGVMPRVFLATDFEPLVEDIRRVTKRGWPGEVTVDVFSRTAPWEGDPTSWLFEAAKRAAPGWGTHRAAGGLELAVLQDKYPEAKLIGFGPTIRNPHTNNEEADVATFSEVAGVLHGTILGLCRDVAAAAAE